MDINYLRNRFLGSYALRIKVFTGLSSVMNLAFAAFKLVAGILYHSNWLKIIATYFAVLTVARFLVAYVSWKQRDHDDPPSAYRLYGAVGALLLTLSVTMLAAVWLMVFFGRGFQYPGILIYAVAAYTVYKLAMSIANLHRGKNAGDLIVKAIHRINHADALVSLLALQSSLLFAFGHFDGRFAYRMNAITGSVICGVVMMMAISMLRTAVRCGKPK